MHIKVNGNEYNVDDNITLEKLINQLNISPQNIIAEVNGSVITRDRFSDTVIENNAVVELIKFVGGG